MYFGSIVKLMIATILYIVQGCQFTDYEGSLLTKDFQIESTFIDLQGSTKSFAFWSFCIPAWEVDKYPAVEEVMILDNRNAQLLFVIYPDENEQSPIIFMYVDFISGYNEVIHSIHINTQLQEKVYEYKFDSGIYEGKWYLSMITIGSKFIKFQTSESKNDITIQDEIPLLDTFQIIIGGTGIISEQYFLGIFRGRLSKLIIIEDEANQNLLWVLSNCQIPITAIGGKTIQLIDDLLIFNGNTYMIKEIDQVGKSFRFICWVKYDFSEATFTTYLLLRLTIFKNYGNELNLGDELAKITVDLDNSQPQNCGYDVISHMYTTPTFGLINKQYEQKLKFRDAGGYYQQGLQQWHIVQFFYRQTEGPSVTFNFISSNKIIHEKFNGQYAKGLFTNTKYYAIFGSDRTIQQKLRGQIANAKFEYNYEENTELNIDCHYTCSKCNGPLQTNCLECDIHKNRIFSEDLKICSCKYNFIEQQGECKSYSQIYFNIEVEYVSQYQNILICEYGYFYLPTIKKCIKCPQESKITILCADCLIYPSTWYVKPMCTIDFIVSGASENSAYRLEKRSTANYDVYLIDEDANLVLIDGAKDYCNATNYLPNCFPLEQTHLLEPVYIICKQDHYIQDNKCLKGRENCIKSFDYQNSCQQCEDGYYLYHGVCKICKEFCIKCKMIYGFPLYYKCLQCQDGYEINNSQGCTKCGHNCQICKFQQRDDSNEQILRCLKCVHDQKYYISLDGENCFENQIQNCLYAFDVFFRNSIITSLDYELFIILYYSESICGQCKEKYTYNLNTNQCEPQQSNECYYSYSYNTMSSLKEVCLFGPKINEIGDPISFITERTSLDNCHIRMILETNKNVSYICLVCNNGYYAEKLTGNCLPCPSELRCQVCYQQNKISKDNWKNQVRAFYTSFIKHSFIEYGLSQNIEDYEIVCQFCIDGYEFHNEKCIPVCPSSCLKCKIINDENICIECPLIQGKRSLSINNNQCIQCPGFCVICRIREQEEIKIINPVFNNLDFYYYSNQCLQKQQGYYDSDLKMYIDCPFEACLKKIHITLFLYCSKEEYDSKIQLLNSEEDVKRFKKQNILIDDLFSNSSFPQFEQPEFYQMANEQAVKSIIIAIYSIKPQTCLIYNTDRSIKQKFSQNIFSAINVQLELYGIKDTIFEYDKTIQIVNFKKVIINGIILQPTIYVGFKQLFFNSVFEQTIHLINIRYRGNIKEYDIETQILIWNSTDVLISTFTIQDIYFSRVEAFILVEKTNSVQRIVIEQLNVTNCRFLINNALQFNTKSTDQVLFNQSNFNSISFYRSKLIYSTLGSLIIQDSVIQACWINSVQNLIRGESLMQMEIRQVLIQTNTISNSKIFAMSAEFVCVALKFMENSILEFSSFISNVDSSIITAEFIQLELSLNLYDTSAHFIQINKDKFSYQKLKCNGLTLHGNVLNRYYNNFPQFNQNEFLIFLEADDINIKNLDIRRNFGVTDILIQKVRLLELRKVRIQQDKSYQIQGLHQYEDCVKREAEKKYSFSSLYLYDIKSIQIQEFLIESFTIINNPIIQIIQADLEFSIIISEVHFKNNLILTLNSSFQASILQIKSQSNLFTINPSINIFNSVMENNLKHQYHQSVQINSALLINFDCLQCTTYLENLTIQANLVTNSTQSILFLKSNRIKMYNAVFRFNCISNFSILQPYILWGFTNNQKIFLENILDIFPIKVSTGNAKLEGQEIYINNLSISNSTGSGLYITLLNEAICVMNDIVFTSIKSLFLEKNENGGAIVIDTTQIINAIITISTIRLSNIQCRQKGGFIYLINGQGKCQIVISDVNIQDVYALQGSIIYNEISAQSNTSKLINLSNFEIWNTHYGQMSFLSQFNNLDDLDEFYQLSYQRYLICIYNAQKIVISNFSVLNLKYESFLQITNTFSISINKLIISQSIFLNSVIQIDSKNKNSTILMRDLQISNISIFAVIPDKFECIIQQINPIPQQIFSCLNQSFNRISPQKLPQYYENFSDKQAACVINKMKQNKNKNLSVIDIIPFKSKITIQQILFYEIDCESCQNGLFNIPIKESQSNLDFNYLNFYRNKCGKSSCINIYNNIQSHRRLQQLIQYVNSQNYQVNVLNYKCQYNQGYEGTCLRIQNITTLILSSIFQNNIAIHRGGAILVIGFEDFYIQQSIIIENIANFGGGIYMADQISQNMTLLGSLAIENNAKKYGNDAVQVPSQLAISIDTVNYLKKITILQTENLVIEQVYIKEYEVMKNVFSDTIYFPNGQTISQYQYFNWQVAEYQSYNLHLRIAALDQYGSIIKNLEKTSCSIKGRLLDDDLEKEFTTNFTNLDKVEFDNQEYNLDKIVIYLDNDLNMTLQLQFNCNSIYIPVKGKQQQIQSYHQNYFLRMNVKSFPCQLGEIKKISTKICVPCDPEQGQYSLEVNAQQCSIIDDISTIEIKSAQLNLREGFWRPYINTNSISQCINLLLNCNGGWSQGDNSCYHGHIGALCEECDIYDSRGYGQFSTSVKYSCASCVNNVTNVIIITLITIWTLISILISVKSTLSLIEQIAIQILMTRLKFIKKQKYSYSAILIKMLTNHLQILTAITTFKIDFSYILSDFINATGNPIQTATYSLDCFLVQMFSVEIHYARIIWQLIMPFLYISFFLGIYFIIVKFCATEYSLSVITTTFIYIYIQIQPNLVGGFISLISFRSISGYQWIQANVAYRFDTSQHFFWLAVFCLPGLFLFAFLIPSLIFIALYVNRNILNEKRIRQKFGYLYNEYKTDAFFWEIVKIVEKELVIIFLTYYDDNIIQKGTLVLLVIYLYSELNYRFRPYKMRTLNNLDAHSAKVCQISILLACGIYISQLYDNFETQIPYFFILAILNFFYLLQLLNQILKSYWEELDDQLDKLREKIIAIAPWTMDYPYLRIYLESSSKRKKRIQGQYQKIKKYLLSYAKPIKELKDNLDSMQHEIRPSINMSITIKQIRLFREISNQP